MIYLEETQDREAFVSRVLSAEVDSHVKDIEKVLIKPNIVSHEPYPTTTHPIVLKTCIEYFAANHKEITVADGPAFDAGDSATIIANHELKRVCDDLGVPLINLLQQPTRRIETGDIELEVQLPPSDYDFLLSLPVLKSHFICKFTGALKNQFGFFSLQERLNLHFGSKDIHQAIAQINTFIKPNFYIVDAVETFSRANEVRHGGRHRDLGFMLAGADPVGLDAIGLELLKRIDPKLEGKSYNDIPYLRHAIHLDLGCPHHTHKSEL